ncbi:hypothetical protein GLOIN_2v1881634 [Rhizophagus clarus]|uniref:F-box domain-containing protein n=1 Tax=Rhizophagus clarus TaxID=94130 RepID=A0A8H3KUX7_9GLOM|nr:hypothetical protein GLOIN_2v1881634 [Rhizophagus clarus]
MPNLNKDVLYLIFKRLQDDKNTLLSCLLVDKTWCETIIPILWRNPWESLKTEDERLLLNVIISHLSNESRNKIGELKLYSYEKSSFDYIRFCRHLNLDIIQRIIDNNINENDKNLKVKTEILNLFVNENMKFTHLYICNRIDFPIHLIHGAERCFSEIEFLRCTNSNDDIIVGLTEICKFIRELELSVDNLNYEIIRLIEAQKKLLRINLCRSLHYEAFFKTFENSLIKHANNIQYFKMTKRPTTRILSYFVNLRRLELGESTFLADWNCLKNLSLPLLEVLKTSGVPSEVLTSLIKNTNGFLYETKIEHSVISSDIDNKRLIQAIHQNCPILKYLKLMVCNINIIELEMLLINCQCLNELNIIVDNSRNNLHFDWNKLFEILAKSSPNSLSKFIFGCFKIPSEFLKIFFDNWNERNPLSLEVTYKDIDFKLNRLIQNYKAKGIVKEFQNRLDYNEFKWELN